MKCPRPTPHILGVLALFAALLALPAASSQAQTQTPTQFTAQLFGQAEIPPVQTEDSGSCLGILDETGTVFSLSCEHTVTEATAAHIHTGFGDENGPVLFNLGVPASPIQVDWLLTPEHAIRLLAGGLYINVHTDANPGGVIRGQLRPTQPLEGETLSVALSSEEVVPAVTSSAKGACFLGIQFEETTFTPPQEVELDIRCSVQDDDSDATLELVLDGGRGETGTTVIPVGNPGSPFHEVITLTGREQVSDFRAGRAYLQVRTEEQPAGELRGQLDGCLNNAETLCLNQGRFAVTVDWDSTTDTGDAFGVRETDDSGMFWFFRPSNLEMLVKVLDGCGVNGHYWVFYSATTNVGFDIEVVDTESGETMIYSNELGTPAAPGLDTTAFDACP